MKSINKETKTFKLLEAFKELTQQEKRLFQDVDTPNDKHSNGMLPPLDDSADPK